MDSLRQIVSRLRAAFGKRHRDRALDEELQTHLALLVEQNIERGMSPEGARRAAKLSLGGSDQIKESVHDHRGLPFVETFVQDVRYALRMLRKSPGFAAVAIITLALGIGANTAIFSVVDAVLLRPLPFKDPSRLVMIWEGFPSLGFPKTGASVPDLMMYERAQKSFEYIGAFQNKDFDLSGGGEPERITGARVSASIFPMLGIQPLLGRTYTQQEDKPGTNVVVLSYGLWQQRYSGNRGVIGNTIMLDRVPYAVVGVMPKSFQFPMPGPQERPQENNKPAELWVPMAFTMQELQNQNGDYSYGMLARLRLGVTIQEAQAEANLLGQQIERQYPAGLMKFLNGAQVHFGVFPLQEEIVGSVQTLLVVLMAAVGMVLLIACANVATLLLSRATSRQREIAIRTALGASRIRLVRQMFTESVVLALAGGALGILIALWGTGGLFSLVPSSVPLPHVVSFGGPVLAFVAAVCCATAVIFGVAPAFQVSALSLHGSLQEGGRSGSPGRARHRLQGFFVTAEFALALLLLVGAGLLIRSFSKLLQTNPGFRPDHVLTMSVPLPDEAYPKAAQIRQFYQGIQQRIVNLPGVRSVGIVNDLPLNGVATVAMEIEGQQGSMPSVSLTWVLGNYFTTMGIPLLKGRLFTPEDRAGSQPVVIISEDAAKKFWPGQDAIGKRVETGGTPGMATIIGIVADVDDGPLGTTPLPHVYVPYLQLPDQVLEDRTMDLARSMHVAVRTATNPDSITSAVTAQVHAVDPDIPVAHIATMDQELESSVAGPQFSTLLLGIFATMALFLAAIGIYGVLAYTITQQTHEIGIRMALGAQQRDVLRLILKQGTALALAGVGIGAVAAFLLTHLMASLLYGVSATDPVTFVGVAVLLVGVALLACYIPARRAMRTDPMVALRYE
jgi:putative ABC transport system permease protein